MIYGMIATHLWASQLDFPKVIQFQPVPMGEEVILNVTGVNSSGNTITISRIKTSCGCTSVEFEKKSVLPGEKIELTFKVQTEHKRGHFKKNARVYYEHIPRPQLIFILGKVLAEEKTEKGHPPKEKGLSLFSKKCVDCHLKPGIGKNGEQLYFADCAFCHGTNRQGGHGPPLKAIKPEWYEIISKGKGASMPGFAKAHGGPRTEVQLESLLRYLGKSNEERERLNVEPKDIFFKKCFVCHESEIAPKLEDRLPSYDTKSLFKLLTRGTDHLMMPSFLKEKGGSLSEEEISALVQYLLE
jgi:cytochrome c5